MRSAVFHGKEDVTIEDVPEPGNASGKILVQVEWCGLCGTDLHLYQLGPEVFGDLTKHGETPPFALGHEFCGRVRSPPPESGFQDGDLVMVDPRLPCRECFACRSGKDYSCPRQGGYGYNHGGGFAEQVAVRAENLHRIPDTIPSQYAALIEPFAVALHGIRMTGITDWTKQKVLVLGGGPIGFALVLALRAYQPEKIIVSEPTAERRKQISDFVDISLDPRRESVVDKCHQMTGGEGIDIVIDCAGVPAGLSDGLNALKCEGTYMNLAMHDKPFTLPMLTVLPKHITIRFAMVYNNIDFDEAIRLFAEGKFHGYERMVTGRIAVDDIVEKGFKELINHRDDHIKILVTPKGSNLGLAG